MLRLFNTLGDRMLSAFVPKVDAEAACRVWSEFCYCSGTYAISRSCNRGCDSSQTSCGPCNIRGARGSC